MGTIPILLHLMRRWQMNMNLTRSIVALLLLYAAGIFAFIAALANEPPAKKPTAKPGTVFRDCPDCPEMVMLPRGPFVMGAPPGEEERENAPDYFRGHSVPQHSVTIQHSFAIAKFDVTRDEYAQFVAETNRADPDSCYTPDLSGGESDRKGANWHSPGFPQTGRDPVVCVNWDDAQAYLAWLSAKAGHVYRLPTEAEWEYAARGGTTTARYGSDRPAELCRYINHGDLDFSERHPRESDVNRECRDGYAFTSPVGSFPPNQFGLCDMLGNVWQWTEDWWNDDYKGAPSDGSSWQNGNCRRRVMRGGAYSNIPALVRSAVRLGAKSPGRDHSGGFRVARTFESDLASATLLPGLIDTDVSDLERVRFVMKGGQVIRKDIQQKLSK